MYSICTTVIKFYLKNNEHGVPISHFRVFFFYVLLEFADSGENAVAMTTNFGQLLVPLFGEDGVLVFAGRPVSLGLSRGLEVDVTYAAEEVTCGFLEEKFHSVNY